MLWFFFFLNQESGGRWGVWHGPKQVTWPRPLQVARGGHSSCPMPRNQRKTHLGTAHHRLPKFWWYVDRNFQNWIDAPESRPVHQSSRQCSGWVSPWMANRSVLAPLLRTGSLIVNSKQSLWLSKYQKNWPECSLIKSLNPQTAFITCTFLYFWWLYISAFSLNALLFFLPFHVCFPIRNSQSYLFIFSMGLLICHY